MMSATNRMGWPHFAQVNGKHSKILASTVATEETTCGAIKAMYP
jgi:hypothetical protein